MPKMKTHKGIKKRVRVSPRGKVKHRHPNTGHLMSGKRSKRRRALRRTAVLKPAMAARLREALGV